MHKCLFDLFLSLEIYNLLLNLAPHVDERCFFLLLCHYRYKNDEGKML